MLSADANISEASYGKIYPPAVNLRDKVRKQDTPKSVSDEIGNNENLGWRRLT
jgi:hypothetical protein